MTPPTITQQFPPLPLDEVVARIKHFDDVDLDERLDTIRAFVRVRPIMCYDWGGDWRYRRARKVGYGQMLANVSELIWRSDVPARLGRANPAGFPVLYLADRLNTALSEIRLDEGDVVLTEFRIRDGRSARVAPIGEMATIQRTGRGYLAGTNAAFVTDFINACDRDAARSMLIVDAFLLSCLANTEDDYLMSSAVALAAFEKLSDLDAVVYPSRRQTSALNFAVRPESIWRDWGIVSVRSAHARHLAMGYYELSNIRHVSCITHSGSLVWDDDVEEPEQIKLLDPPWYQL